VLLHLGLHRTGSTWLQQRVFDGRDGRPTPMVPDRAESARRIVLAREEDFDADELRRWLAERVESVRRAGGVPVLSNERFSGNPHSGWFDAQRTFDRLAEVLPEAKVLLVLREQRDLVRSLWLQYVRIGGPASLRDYLRAPDPGDHRAPCFDPSFLRFDRLVESLDRRFGREQVLAIPYDRLRQDPRDFLARIGAFLGTEIPPPEHAEAKVYASPGFVAASLQRRVNLWCVRSTLHRAPPLPSPRLARLSGVLASVAGRLASPLLESSRRRAAAALVEARLAEVPGLRESNARLAERIGEDLRGFGWMVP
ncbi:MAG: sulfotransferase, partial [Phycisphaerales bacterium]